MSKKVLIAYYSRAGENYVNGSITDLPVGNTERAAKMIQKQVGGELLCIDTVKPYPLEYTRTTEVAMEELRSQARPELKSPLASIDDFDTVFLGYPNWWGTFPMAVYTFLEAYDFSGKVVLPFCTHEGSGLGRSEEDIRKSCPGAAVKMGIAIRGGSVGGAEPAVTAWIRKNRLTQ